MPYNEYIITLISQSINQSCISEWPNIIGIATVQQLYAADGFFLEALVT